MFCRAIFQEDGLEYEGTIESIENSADGQYTVVKFIGYGNEDTVWLKDLLESKGEEARQKQTKESIGETSVNEQVVPEAKIDSIDVVDNKSEVAPWKVGMFCRAIFQEDGLEYEGTVQSIESCNDGQYSLIKFVGYGNEETIWLKDLLQSKGEEARKQQTKEALGETTVNEQDVPSSEAKVNPSEVNGLPQNKSLDAAAEWKVGMFCSGIFQDGLEHEAIVKSVQFSDDAPYLSVKIIGYETDETIWLQDVKKTKGEEARQKQFKEAKGTPDIKETTAPPNKSGDDNTKVNEAATWQAGMFCRGIFQADGLEYEGLIKSIAPSDNGNNAVVQFIGYDNEETILLQNLLESKGDEARQKQTKESKGTIAINGQEAKKKWKIGDHCRAFYAESNEVFESKIEEMSYDDNNDEYAILRIIGYGTAHCVWPKDLEESHGKEARDKQIKVALKDIDSQKEEAMKLVATSLDSTANTSGSNDRTTVIEKKVLEKKWNINDYFRVVCKFDGLEHEAQIIKQHPNDPNIFRYKVLGRDDIIEVGHTNGFKESLGETARRLEIETAVKNEVLSAASNETSTVTATTASGNPGVVNGDQNNNYPSGNGVQNVGASGINWQHKYEKQSAKVEEMTKVNKVLMNTLNNLEQEILVYGQVIGELKSVLKASLQESAILEPEPVLVNGHI
jgi:hypothetical protein